MMDGFFARVYEMVRQIPEGRVATYGQVALLVGEPRKARFVGFALHANPHPWTVGEAVLAGMMVGGSATRGNGLDDAPNDPSLLERLPVGEPRWPGDTGAGVPCHRVVFADGRLASGFVFGGPGVQRALLEAEGVRLLPDIRVDLRQSRWQAGL